MARVEKIRLVRNVVIAVALWWTVSALVVIAASATSPEKMSRPRQVDAPQTTSVARV